MVKTMGMGRFGNFKDNLKWILNNQSWNSALFLPFYMGLKAFARMKFVRDFQELHVQGKNVLVSEFITE